MSALQDLQDLLAKLNAGPVPEDHRSRVEGLLADAWDELEGDDGGMQPYKLRRRTEGLMWDPPALTFNIERHGGTVLGSKYAEVQEWEVDTDRATASLVNYRSPKKRLLRPMQKATETGPIAAEIAAAIRDGRNDPRLQWTKDRSKVRVLTREVFPSAAKQTTEGRTKRLRRDLVPLLVPYGWDLQSGVEAGHGRGRPTMSDGTGRIYRRGNIWWIQYGFRGKVYRETSGSNKTTVARKLLKKRMEEMGRGRLVGPQEERVTFADLAGWIEDDYAVKGRKSTAQLKSTLKRLRAYFADLRALDITTDRLRAYVRVRQEEGYANGTIKKDLAAVKRALNLGIQAGRLSTKPHVPTVNVNDVREGFMTTADVDAICREIGPDLAPMVRFAALTGWRRSEVRSLRWQQVDFDAETVRLEPGTTKNRDGRTFPFRTYPPLKRLLATQRERTREVERRTGRIVPWVFHRDGEEIRSFRGAWRGATKRAGLTGAWFHDLRRTAVRNLERAGVSRSVAMRLTGHKTEAVYRRYAITDSVVLEEGVEKLARLHETERPTRDVLPLERRGKGTITAQSEAGGS